MSYINTFTYSRNQKDENRSSKIETIDRANALVILASQLDRSRRCLNPLLTLVFVIIYILRLVIVVILFISYVDTTFKSTFIGSCVRLILIPNQHLLGTVLPDWERL